MSVSAMQIDFDTQKMNQIAIGDAMRDEEHYCGDQQNSLNCSLQSTLSENELSIESKSDEADGEIGDEFVAEEVQLQCSNLQFCIDRAKVTEFEKHSLPEFFNRSKKGKSLESYLAIRNAFLEFWEQNSSNYQKRIGFREVLKSVKHLRLGNVTAFSRVHKFLDSTGVINCNLSKQIPIIAKNTVRKKRKRFKTKSATIKNCEPIDPELREKKRKSYVNHEMLKLGINLNGGGDGQNNSFVSQALMVSSSRTRPNPFKLVPCEVYDVDTKPPFAVQLSMEALAIVDVHAHCVQTEVIGLLGGLYCPKLSQLVILTAEPCLTLDDHEHQCEMDPVSQAAASEKLASRGYLVCGWYHSHPTFVPNPSLRDLDTQSRYQSLFASESGQPFIALILSPYSTLDQPSAKNTLVSKYKCLIVSDDQNGEYRVPYELTPQLIRREKMMFSIIQRLSELLPKIRNKSSAVNLLEKIKKFRGQDINYLQKLMCSLKYFLELTGLSQTEIECLLENCQHLLMQNIERHSLNNNNSRSNITDDNNI